MQEARQPDDKLQKCRMLLRTFYKRRKVTLRELQSLLALLNFTCSVIVPGRAFLHRMIDLTKGAKRFTWMIHGIHGKCIFTRAVY